MCTVTKLITKILLILGALNLGFMGFFNLNFIGEFLGGDMGEQGTAARVAFSIIGLAGLLALVCWIRYCCGDKSSSCGCGCDCKSCCKKK